MDLNSGFTLIDFLLFLVIGVLVFWIATLEWRLLRYTRTLRLVFQGRSGADLEQMLREYLQRMDRADHRVADSIAQSQQALDSLTSRLTALEELTPLNIRHVGVVRFNPYADKGSDQSFAIALLDDHADGVVLNGLHSRETCRVYAKPIVAGNSTYQMTEEEKQAIARAMSPRGGTR